MRKSILLTSAALLTLACSGADRSGSDAATGGTFIISTSADADILLPPLVRWIQGKQITDLLFDPLAEIGDELNTVGDDGFKPRLAERWEWSADSMSIAFHLDPRARWHDGRPIRASDVTYTYSLYANPVVGAIARDLMQNLDSVTARDSMTSVFWFKARSPDQFYEASYQMRILPEHLLREHDPATLASAPIAREPVGSGPFRFVRWNAGSSIELEADTNYYRGRAKLDRVIWTVAPNYTAATTRLFAGEADFHEALRREQIPEAGRHPDLKVVPYPGFDYAFVLFNLRDPANSARPHPIFGDRETRRALSMAVDRETLVRAVFDSNARVALGPFVRGMASADTNIRQIPYDVEGARAKLDSIGWQAGADGIRRRNGRPLAFTLLVPSSSAFRVSMSVMLQEQLRNVGAQVNLETIEPNAFQERQGRRRFDAVFGAWHLDPSPGGIRQTHASAAATDPQGSNYGSYMNPRFDALVDTALMQTSPDREHAYFRQAYQLVVDDAPAIHMYEIRNMAGMHKRIRPTGMRADAWWAALSEWSIAPEERIPRDRIGLGQPTP
jgi:peptide/nickel transport system substrate-binding protein